MAAPLARRTRPRQRPEESRAQILAAADALLRERPYRELSMGALMERAGSSRTLFYKHFADMPDLVAQLLWLVGTPLREEVEEMALAPTEPARLREGLGRVVDFWAANGPLIAAVVEAAGHDRQIEELYETLLERFTGFAEAGIRAAQDAGLVGALDARATAEALTAMNERYLLRTFGRTPRTDRETAVRTLFTIWSRTLYGRGG